MGLWLRIVEAIEGRISSGELKPGDRLESEEVLALQFDASRQTVHKAVQELKRRGLVDRKRRWGTTICEPPPVRSSGLIGLLFDYANDYPQGELLRGVQSALTGDQRLVLVDSKGDYQAEAEELNRCRKDVAGILAYALSDQHNENLFRQVAEESRRGGPPLVFIDRLMKDLGSDSVVSDNLEASRSAVEWALDQGHTRIVFLSGDNPHVSSVFERHQGYREACLSRNCYDPTLERWFPKAMESKPDHLATAARDALYFLLGQAEPVTALFCTQDIYAAAASEALDRIGADRSSVTLITYNDWPGAVLPRVSEFARIIQPMQEVGRRAVELLSNRLEHPESPWKQLRLKSQFLPPSRQTSPSGTAPHTNEGTHYERT